ILERDYQGKPEGYIEKMIESGDAGITLNRNQKASDAAEEIYEDAWDAYREVSDLYKDTEWEDLGPTEKEHVRDTVNYQALAQTGKLDFGDGGPLMTNTAEALRYDF
ncbi:MAG: hypothetical protein GWN89_07605, partial [Thermoplasmata archaeon]|nr:hypothetical protein [Thermoplasmata archaeon]NIT76987.1 hypothetical protein [Thermoplasmata archaeon]NIY03358.1 hypothetical protein [Thermoplasmata archaeon]